MTEQPAQGFAGLLRQLWAAVRLTQEELAEAAGLSPRSVSDLERGINRTARKDTAESLAGALGLAEPVRAVFVAAARGRATTADVLAAMDEGGRRSAAAEDPAADQGRCVAGVPVSGADVLPGAGRADLLRPRRAGHRPRWCSDLWAGWTVQGFCWWPGSRGRASRPC